MKHIKTKPTPEDMDRKEPTTIKQTIEQEIEDFEGQLFGHGEEVIEVSVYRKDGKILSIPYSKVKQWIRHFASTLIERVGESIIGEDDENPYISAKGITTTDNSRMIRNGFRAEQRSKLQEMKG